MIQANQLKKGSIIKLEGALCLCLEYQHVKPGKGGAFVRTKLKMIEKGALVERTFRSEEKLEEAHVERRKIQYLYRESNQYILMDLQSYEQFNLSEDGLGCEAKFLMEGMELEASVYEGRIIGLILPIFVERKVIHTEPGVRGNTVTNATKPATVEGDYELQVPLFVQLDDVLKIDTRTGEYVVRVST